MTDEVQKSIIDKHGHFAITPAISNINSSPCEPPMDDDIGGTAGKGGSNDLVFITIDYYLRLLRRLLKI
jgi:hypothetical protein